MNDFTWIFVMIFLLAVTGLEFQENSDSCIKNSDCGTKNAICSDGQCTCDNISYNGTGSCLSYVTEYMEYCEEQKQCEWLGSNSDCIENQCVCRKNYQWFQGSCQYLAGKGTSCESSTECVDRHDIMSMQCSSDTGKCTCAEGYYDRGSDCRKKSSVGNACALDIDCQSTELSCTLGKCTAANKTVEKLISYNNEYSPSVFVRKTTPSNVYGNIDCSFDNDCLDMANSFCNAITGKCVCNEKTHYLHEGNCLPGFGFCQQMTHCANWTNSFCFKNSCVCSRGFFLHEGKCIAEIGMPDPSLKSDKDCVIKPGKLVKPAVGPTCVCKTYWSSDDANRNCIKTMLQGISSCLTNDWCDAMGPYSFCNSSTKKCQCNRFATLDESNYYCVKTDEPTGGCLKDSGCKINEKCIDEECKCIENYSRHDNVCLPDIGGLCDTALCTHIPNSGCAQGVCQCFSNYIGQKNKCYKVAESLNDSCEIDEQCRKIRYSKCDSTNDGKKTCICKNRYNQIDDYCLEKKEYGDACMKHTDCTLVLNHSFECRKSRCQCPLGKKLKDGYCTSSSTKYSVAISLLLLSTISLCVNII